MIGRTPASPANHRHLFQLRRDIIISINITEQGNEFPRGPRVLRGEEREGSPMQSGTLWPTNEWIMVFKKGKSEPLYGQSYEHSLQGYLGSRSSMKSLV